MLVLVAGAAGWRLRVLRGEVAVLRERVDGRAGAQMRARHDQFWEDLRRLQRDHAATVDARLNRVEASATRLAAGQSQLDQRVGAIEPWVQHWAGAARQGDR